jgi:hypothetical protein
MIKSPGTPEKDVFYPLNENMFSGKKYQEILEKSKEKKRYQSEEVKEESEEHANPPFTSTD